MSNQDLTKAPATSGFTDLSLAFPEPVRLDNGIELWVVGGGEDEIVRVSALMSGGLYDEEKTLQSVLTALTLYEGSDRRSAEEVAEALDYYGAGQSTVPSDHHMLTSMTVMNRNLEHVLPLMLEALTSATFKSDDIAPYMLRMKAQCELALERVKYLAAQEVRRLFYGDKHPLAVTPQPADVDRLNADDLRRFHARHNNVENCVLVASGKVGESEIALLNDTFGRWDRHGEPTPERQVAARPSSERRSVVDRPGSVQSAVALALPGVPRSHPDYIPLRILTTVLGGYFGSRLMANIREDKGYTYGIGASLLGRRDGSAVVISSECDTRYTAPLLDEVYKEMGRLREELIPDNELNIVRRYMLSDLAKTLDTPFSIASSLCGRWLYGTYPEYFNDQVRIINEIDSNQLLETARRYYNLDQAYLAVAGDKDKLKL